MEGLVRFGAGGERGGARVVRQVDGAREGVVKEDVVREEDGLLILLNQHRLLYQDIRRHWGKRRIGGERRVARGEEG